MLSMESSQKSSDNMVPYDLKLGAYVGLGFDFPHLHCVNVM